VTCNLADYWLRFAIPIPEDRDLGHIISGFSWTATSSVTFYLDDIFWVDNPALPPWEGPLICSPTPPTTATPTPTSTLTVSVTSTQTHSPTPTLTITPTPIPTYTPTATPPCPVTGATDEETIRALVLAEAGRVLEQDLDGVVALFDENALKWDKARNQSWQGKARIREYYEDAWRDIVYTQVLHTNIVITVTGTTATARNDSSGTYIDRKTSEVGSWDNPRGDSWTFARGTDGCWLITSHRFNLSPDDP